MTLRRRLRSFTRHLAAATLAASLGFGAPGCHNYYATGLEALAAGNLDLAEREAREGLTEEPRDPELNLLLARVLVQREAWAEARPYAERAAEGLPEDMDAVYTHGLVQLRVGSLIEAARHLTRAWQQEPGRFKAQGAPDLVELLPQAIDAAADSDVPEAAVDFILTLRKLQADHPAAAEEKLRIAREAVGLKLQRLGRYADAAAWYGDLYTLYPEKNEFLLEQASILLALDQNDKALLLFDRYAEARNPKDTSLRLSEVGRRAHLRRRDDVAETYWKRAAQADPQNAPVHLELARLQLRQSRTEEGWASLRAWLDANGKPAPPEAWLKAAEAALDANQGPLAVELLDEANRNAKPSFAVVDRLADLLLRRDRRGDMEDALRLFIQRSAEADPASREEALLLCARWLQAHKELDAAAFYFTEATKISNKPEHFLALAKVLAEAQRRQDMIGALQGFLRASAQQPVDYVTAAALLLANRQYDTAEEITNQGLKKHPGNDELTRFMAKVLYESGFLDREEKLWRDWIKRQKEPARASLEIGQLYARRLDAERARPLLEDAARSKDIAAEALLALGDMFRERGMDRDMRLTYEKYLSAAPDRAAALEAILPRYNQPAFAEDALRVLDELIKLKPEDAELSFEAGRRFLSAGDAERALAYLLTYLDRSKNPVSAARKAGRLLHGRGQHQLALVLYQRLLDQHANNPAFFADLGELFWELADSFTRFSPEHAQNLRQQARDFFLRYTMAFPATPEEPTRELTRFATSMASPRYAQYGLSTLAFGRAVELGHALRPNEHFEYGEALLYTNDAKAADVHFKEHLKEARPKGPRLFAIGDAAFRAGAWELATRYLQRVLDENVEAYVSRAYDELTTIYLNSGKRDRVEPLTVRYLELTRATPQARLKAASVYEDAGLWKQALREYRDLLKLRPDNAQALSRIAEVTWKSGDRDQAAQLFADASSSAADPSAAWEAVGHFYLKHDEPARALDAFNKALQGSGGSWRARLHRGALRLGAGQRDDALADFEAGLDAADDLNDAYAIIVAALLQTPAWDDTLRFTQEAISRVSQPALFQRTLADLELQRGDSARGVRDAAKWATLTNDLPAHIDLLAAHDHNLEIVDALRGEVDEGDPARVENLILRDPDNLQRIIDQVGLQRLPMLVQPLLVRQADPANLHRDVGLVYAATFQPSPATINLAAASTAKPLPTDLTLGRLYLQQDQPQRARDAFIRYTSLHAEQPTQLRNAARAVVHAWLLHNRYADADAFLKGALDLPVEDTLMLPLHTELLLTRGQRDLALGGLRDKNTAHLFKKPTVDLSPTDADALNNLLDATGVLASFGFTREAAQLLAQLHDAHPRHPRLLLALIELGARASHPDTDAWIKDLLGLHPNIPEQHNPLRLRLADALLRANDLKRATPVLLDLLRVQDDDLAGRAFDRLANLAWRSDDLKLLDDAQKAHLDARADSSRTLLDQARTYRRLNLLERATERLERAIALTPGRPANYFTLLQTASLTGDPKLILSSLQRYNAVSTDPAASITEVGRQLAQGPDSEPALAWWSLRLDAAPANAEAHLQVARLQLLRGDHAAGRKTLERLLDLARNNPVTAEDALRTLDHTQRWEDLLAIAERVQAAQPQGEDTPKVAAKRGALPALTPRSWLHIGTAHYARNQRDKALANFDAFTTHAPDPLLANLDAAHAITRVSPDKPEALQDALAYTERAIARAPDAPGPYLRRAELRLRLNDPPGALQDIHRYLQRGDLDAQRGLTAFTALLLQRGRIDDATPLLLRLATLPTVNPGDSLATTLEAFHEAKRDKEGLHFLTTHFPELARAPWAHHRLTTAIANLHLGAGNKNRAFDTFDRGLLADPDNPILLNNLAWALANAGEDLPRAEHLARRALTAPELSQLSQGYYLDTLARIHMKMGKTQEALSEQRLALRLVHTAGADEPALYLQLAEILDALKQPTQAQEARLRASTPRPAPSPGALAPPEAEP